MKLIAHRGNTQGRKKHLENHPNYITSAINQGFDVEVDAWITDTLYLGHDKPQYHCPISFLSKYSDKLWIHCKNLKALETLNGIRGLNIFWHQEDDFTLTSKGFIWTYPEKEVSNKSVLVIKDATKYNPVSIFDGEKCYGLCSDTVI